MTEKIKRTINFYELDFEYKDDFDSADGDHFRELFQIIYRIARTREKIRYQQFGEKAIFVQDVKFEPAKKSYHRKNQVHKKGLTT